MIEMDSVVGLVFRFTLEEISVNGTERNAIEEWWAGEIDRLDDGYGYDDLLDRLDRSGWPASSGSYPIEWRVRVGDTYPIDLGEQTDTPVYKRLLAIGKQVRKELASF